MKKVFAILSFALLLVSCNITNTETPVDRISTIQLIKGYTSADNLSFLLENKMSDASIPIRLFVDDVPYTGIIKSQGAGSRFYPKWNYFVELDNGEKINWLNSFNLSAQVVDPSFIRTPLALYIYQQLGFLTFTADPVFFSINDKENGLYLLIEKIDQNYFNTRNIQAAELIKVAFGATFTFAVKNDLSDNFEKKIPDDDNFNNLAEFVHALDTVQPKNIPTAIGKYLNIKQYLRYHAFNSIINNSDGLTNNYYFYKKTFTSPYEIIPWDFDKTFDYKINVGLYGDNEIIKVLFKNEECYALYKQEMKTILNECFTESNLFPVIDKIYNQIKDVYNLDPWLRMNGCDLQNEVKQIKNLITQRRAYLLGLLN